MRTLIALLFCVLLGAQVRVQGVGALFWFPVGFVLSLFVSSQVALPLIMGLPRAVRRVVKGQMRAAVLGFILLAPMTWASLLVGVAWLWPALIEYLARNASFSLGSLLGLIAILLTPFSRKGRADFSEDFDASYGRFCESPVQFLGPGGLTDEKREELFAEACRVLEPMWDGVASAGEQSLLLESHHVFDSDVVVLLRGLARQLIAAGICEVGPLVDELYDLVSPFFDDNLTKDDVRDAFSGYRELDEDPEVQRYRAEVQRLRNEADGLIKEIEGATLEEHQSWEQAEVAYSAALRLNPNSRHAAEAIRRVRKKALRTTKNAV